MMTQKGKNDLPPDPRVPSPRDLTHSGRRRAFLRDSTEPFAASPIVKVVKWIKLFKVQFLDSAALLFLSFLPHHLYHPTFKILSRRLFVARPARWCRLYTMASSIPSAAGIPQAAAANAAAPPKTEKECKL